MRRYGMYMKWSKPGARIELFWTTPDDGTTWSSSLPRTMPMFGSSIAGGLLGEAAATMMMNDTNKPQLPMLNLESGSDALALDPAIWSALPSDLIEKIAARLPIPAIFRLRCVCRTWTWLVRTPRFVALRADAPREAPWFLLCTHSARMLPAYDRAAARWRCLPMPRAAPGTGLLAASASLVCYGDQIGECDFLTVCNPVTQALRPLPCMPRVRLIHKAGMLADRDARAYRVVVVGEMMLDGEDYTPPNHVYHLLCEVYDSATGEWTEGGLPLESAKFGTDPGAWRDGVFFCVTEMPYGVVCYDLAGRGVWTELGAPMPDGVHCPALAEFRGEVIMVAKVVDNTPPVRRLTGFVIWQLVLSPPAAPSAAAAAAAAPAEQQQQLKGEWVEMARVPADLTRDFFDNVPSVRTQLVVAVLGNDVMVTTYQCPNGLVYHADQNTWEWLPQDPFFPRFRDSHLMGFTIEPRIDWEP